MTLHSGYVTRKDMATSKSDHYITYAYTEFTIMEHPHAVGHCNREVSIYVLSTSPRARFVKAVNNSQSTA